MSALPPAEAVQQAALVAGVCIRPIVSNVTDIDTGERRLVPIACGATREDRCPPCADRARRLRMHQCREGWHLTDEPERLMDDVDQDDGEPVDEPGERGRRVRSTRRRDDAPDLPRVPVEHRTVGRVFVAPDGKRYRPSMFLTHTLPSYGRVDKDSVPLDPDSYDYRRAALDAIHFPRLIDRYWQNLRRAAGYQVQYFSVIELQHRGAPHMHAAVRGAIPRRLVREVRAATYVQVWWPAHDEPVYVDRLPTWTSARYVDPDTGEVLPTWDEALDRLDAKPAHVVRFGGQDDIQGLIAGEPGVEWRIGYMCKYLTKSLAGSHRDAEAPESPAREAHVDRLAEEVRWLPCSPTCANWLRFGVQPKDAGPGLMPGHCKGKAHDRENLGLGGRRVLVSRRWTGKSLARHRADRASVIRVALEEAGIDPDDHDELSISGSDGRWSWEILGRHRVDQRTYTAAIATAICTRQKWRAQYDAAKCKQVSGSATPKGDAT